MFLQATNLRVVCVRWERVGRLLGLHRLLHLNGRRLDDGSKIGEEIIIAQKFVLVIFVVSFGSTFQISRDILIYTTWK